MSTTTRHIKVNGVSYKITKDKNGREVYSPPLPESTRAWFERSREDIREGNSPKLGRTDTAFHTGRKTIREQFGDDLPWLRRFDKEYRKQTGKALPDNGVWMSQLADSTFDAKAVITPSMGQADVDKLIQRQADKARREADAPPVRLAEDLVQGKMAEYRAAGDTSDAVELREKVIEKHGQKV